MNRKNLTRILIVLLFVPGVLARAQEPSTPPPRLILAPEGDMKWTITIQPAGSTAPGTFDPSVLEYTHSGEWTRLAATYGAAQKAEWWISHGYVLSRTDSGTFFIFRSYSGPNPSPPAPYIPQGFYGIEKVKPADDRGNANFQGTECRYYSNLPPGTSGAAPPSAPTSGVGYEAWFDLKTGLPVAYRKEGKTYTFKFFPAAPGELPVPPEFQAKLDQYFKNLRANGLMP